MNLFSSGLFSLHSGAQTDFKIDCDSLTGGDLHTLASMATKILPPFSSVAGIPTGGERLAKEMEFFIDRTADRFLICDDVLTTGQSFWNFKAKWPGRECVGLTIFARGPCPSWVVPIFTINPTLGVGDAYL